MYGSFRSVTQLRLMPMHHPDLNHIFSSWLALKQPIGCLLEGVLNYRTKTVVRFRTCYNTNTPMSTQNKQKRTESIDKMGWRIYSR
jgi:hypothetical protein